MKIGVFIHNRIFLGAKLIHIPLLYSLRQNYKDAFITIFSPYQDNGFFNSIGLVDDIITYNVNNPYVLLGKIKSNDMLISLRNEAMPLNISMFLSRVKIRIGFENKISFLSNTITKIFRKDLYRAIVFNELIENPKPINEYFSRYKINKLNNKKCVFILPGGGESFKRWDINNFILLCEKMKDESIKYFFVLGYQEIAYIDKIKKFLYSNDGEILYNCNIMELIAYFNTGDLFIANDCGPAHIAQMMMKPIIILYSDENHRADKVISEWFLPHKESLYIKCLPGKNINTIEPQTVIEKINLFGSNK